MLKRKHRDIAVEKEALRLLVSYISTLERKLVRPGGDLGKREYLLQLDFEIGWGSSDDDCSRECIVSSLNNLTTLLSMTFDLSVNDDLYAQAFLILLPPISLKAGAEQYITGVLKDLQTLSSEDVEKKYDITDRESIVVEASTRYILGLIKRPELSWMARRVQMMAGNPNEACLDKPPRVKPLRRTSPKRAPPKRTPRRVSQPSVGYTYSDIEGSKQALVFDELLDPLNLSPKQYSRVIDRWKSLHRSEILYELNRIADMSLAKRKKIVEIM